MRKNCAFSILHRIRLSKMMRLICIMFFLLFCLAGCSSVQKIERSVLKGYNCLAQRVSEWSFLKIHKQNQIYYDYTILVGTVTCAQPVADAPVVIVAYTQNGTQYDIAHYTVLHEPGPFELAVTKGDYKIVGFVDKNSDLTYQAGEPIGQYSQTPLCINESGRTRRDLNFVISYPAPDHIDFPPETAVVDQQPEHLNYTSPGTVTSLEDPIFDFEHGVDGYWEPMIFFKTFGGNIFFLADYDPSKIPILFIHGATGSPRGWQYLISTLDRSRYQPWVFYYPSGSSIKSMGDLLFWKLLNLKLKYRFTKLDLVAHSMGGLVMRSFLVDYGQMFPEIQTVISISTPWSGDHMAQMGVSHSPVVLPAWQDMNPESAFFQSIYRRPLPSSVDFYLFFGHRGSRNPLRSNNDGVVTLSSQLDRRAQSEAKKVYGLDEDHDSILLSDKLADQIQIILNTAEGLTPVSDKSANGMLKVHYRFSSAEMKHDIWPWLRLSPISAEDQATEKDDIVFRVSAVENGCKLGPFPVGKYKATLYADAFYSNPSSTRVTIRPDKTAEARFELTPDGWIGDYLCKKMYADKKPPGLYYPADENIVIRSVQLKGNGLVRRLTPHTEKNFNPLTYISAGKDWAFKNHFCFYNLPPGDYQLTIKADGYRPYTEQRQVIPGQSENLFKGIVLESSRSTPPPES